MATKPYRNESAYFLLLSIAATLAFLVLVAVFWPKLTLLIITVSLLAIGGVLLVLKKSDAGLILSLIVAGILAPYLRQLSIVNVGSGDVRLAGLTGLAILALTSFSVLGAHLVQRRPMVVASRSGLNIVLSIFILLNLAAIGNGAMRYGLATAVNDANWLPWIGFLILVVIKPSPKLMKYLGITLLAITVVQSLQGIVRIIQGSGTIYLSTGGERYVAGSTSVWIASGLIISILMLMYRAKNRREQWLFGTLALIQIIGVIISFNRQTWFALAVGLSFGFLFLLRGKRLQLAIRVIGFTLIMFLVIFVIDKLGVLQIQIYDALIQRIAGGSLQELALDPSYQFRLSAWTVAFKGAIQNPMLGLGWGAPFQFSIIVPKTGAYQVFNSSPHNTYLWLAYKSGVFSLFSFLALITLLIFSGARQVRRLRWSNSTLSLYLVAALLIELVFLSGALFWDYLSVAYMSIPFWINTGVIACLITYRPTYIQSE